MVWPTALLLHMLLIGAASADVQGQPPVCEQYLSCLETFQQYARSIWHDSTKPPDSGYFGDGASTGNGGIRGTCGVLLSSATLYRAGRGNPEEQLTTLRKGLRYAALTHCTGQFTCIDGKQWGGSWQSSLWAGTLGLTAALMADRLEPDLLKACKHVVAYEADRLAVIAPPSGWKGDSKAEENAWNSNSLALASAWLADDPRAPAWTAAAKRYLVNTYTVPDTSGDPIAAMVTTQTLYPSFTCENHGFFHPTYQMVAGMSMGDSLLMAQATNPSVAADLTPFAEHNVLPVWRSLSQVLLDSGELAFPSGLDWALHGYGQVSYLAWLATHFDDPLARWAEGKLAGQIAARQRVNGDGRFGGESIPKGFYHEAVAARRISLAWWQHQLGDPRDGPATPPQGFVEHLPDVKLVLQRGPAGFVSLSYGARVMGLVEPACRDDEHPYVATPRYPGLIGRGSFGDPTGAELRRLETSAQGFDADLVVHFGPLEDRHVRFVSFGDAVAIIEVPTPLLEVAGAKPSAFPVGIENDPLTGGTREVEWSQGRRSVKAMSGEAVDLGGSWACISGRLGYIAGPGGRITYAAPGGYNRSGAAEDCLEFVPQSSAAPRYALLLPSADGAKVREVAGTVAWQVSRGVARLAFVSPGGEPRSIAIAIPAELRQSHTLVRPISVAAGTGSRLHGAELAADRDPATFWVSNRDGSQPGHGPTPEHPEWLELTLRGDEQIDEVVILPRPRYGPRRVALSVDGTHVHERQMADAPLRLALPQPAKARRLRLDITASYDPLYPTQPRNVQVAEVLLLRRATGN